MSTGAGLGGLAVTTEVGLTHGAAYSYFILEASVEYGRPGLGRLNLERESLLSMLTWLHMSSIFSNRKTSLAPGHATTASFHLSMHHL